MVRTLHKGPLKQALVSAYKVKADGTRGDLITSKETDDNGGYTLDLGSYTGPVQLEVTVVAGKTTTAYLFLGFIRPILIGRGLPLPMTLVMGGVIGGLIAFGLIGLFIGLI